jgi:Bifunctional DNA primase/polymerase, N-terminal/Primase C terminal 1 (PriCT-1)
MLIGDDAMSLYPYAIGYAQCGLRIFPCQRRGKEPACSRGVHDATNNLDRVHAWWSNCNDLNIGLACGEASGFFVLDVDEGEATLRQLEAIHSPLPATREAITGRDGGRHAYFKQGNHKVCTSAGKIGVGIDVRGDGGYVLLPPSVHPSGRRYRWSLDSAEQIAAAPEWLLAIIADERSSRGKPLEHWHRVLTDNIPEGTRNGTLASVCGKLVHSGLTDVVLLLDVMLCINDARCNPPLTSREVDNIVSSVLRSHLRKLRGNE